MEVQVEGEGKKLAYRKNTQRYAFFISKHLDFPKIKLTFVNVSLKSIPNGGYRDNFLRI